MKSKYKGIDYYRPDYFCGILPEINESRYKFKIVSGSSNKKPVKMHNIEGKLEEMNRQQDKQNI